jgi:hypothetical protein
MENYHKPKPPSHWHPPVSGKGSDSIKIKNNPENNNTFNPIFSPIININTCCKQNDLPAKDCECSGFVRDEPTITADICQGCDLGNSTVVVNFSEGITVNLVGEVQGVNCFDSELVAFGRATDMEGNEYSFLLSLIEMDGPEDRYRFIAFGPDLSTEFGISSTVPDQNLSVVPCNNSTTAAMRDKGNNIPAMDKASQQKGVWEGLKNFFSTE